MTEPTPPSTARETEPLLSLLPWILGLAGGAAWIVATGAIAAGIVLAWYVIESIHWLIAALRPPNHEVVLVYLVPRLVCSALCFAAAYLLGLPWPQIVTLSFVATVLLETLIRLGTRILARPLVERAQMYLAPQSAERSTGTGTGRVLLTALTALLFVLCFSLTSLVYVARETLFDARVGVRNLYDSGLYSALVRVAGDKAKEAARKQRGAAQQAAELLTEDDIRLAEQWALPEPWTTAWLQESLDATLAWMQTTSDQRVPPISIPVSDIERHVKDAASLLLDQHLTTLPACTPGMSPDAYCRPPGMSVDAYKATYKLQNMAAADEILDLVPAELDLSTAVALFGQPFKRPLQELERARAAVQLLDRGLPLAGLLCLALFFLLWLLCSTTRKHRLRWIGTALLLAALVTWVISYAAPSFLPQRIMPEQSARLPIHLSVPLQDFIRATLDTVHTRIQIGAVVLAGLGLLVIWAPLLAPHKETWARRITIRQSLGAGIRLLAATSLLWIVYARAGARLYAQASQAHRTKEIAQANALYRQIDRFYPFRVSSNAGAFVERARSDQYECQLYLEAERAYQAAEWQTAVLHYEAFWLTQPTLNLRDRAQPHLVEALIRWARALEADGQRERALDRYRFVRDEGIGRGRQIDGQPIRVHRIMGTLYLDWGDELLEQSDPEAALATYRRALADTDDPGVWELAEERMIDAYCAWNAQVRQAGQENRAAGICIELGNEFPALNPDPCAACAP